VVVSKFRHPVRSMNPLVRGDTRSDPEPISSNESNVDRFRVCCRRDCARSLVPGNRTKKHRGTLTLLVGAISLGTGRTTVLQGIVHLVIFAAFLFLTAVP
jgi:hypothetical protein